MLELETPVSALPKIGPKYKKLLENLEINTVEDLLYHFPFRYDDFSEIKKVRDLQSGDIATVQGILGPVRNIFTRYRKRLTQTKVVDDTGGINVVWFNSHYLKKTLQSGRNYNFSGKISSFGNRLSLVSPSFELVGEDTLDTGRLVPVYPETAGVSSKWLRARIKHALSKTGDLAEFLPETILEKESLLELNHALQMFHFPDSHQEAEQAKKRFQLEELFLELLNVEKRKETWQEHLKAISINNRGHEKEIRDLRNSLPFRLTSSQEQAIREIIVDIEQKNPMNRLLEGDVGTGKTIVAIISSYITYLNGASTLYMAPTELLARQHYETYKKHLEPFGVRINLLTSSAKTEIGDTAHITIGTHALLFKGAFQKVALVVIDEQHRFGVEQRGKLINLNTDKTTPHLLTMTATPIPRTLALTIYGDLEISKIEAIPHKNKRVATKVVSEKARHKAYQWIKQSGEQTFIVCPLIEESEHESFENVKAATAEFENLKKGAFKNLKIGLLHGKMKSQEKREVVEKFDSGKINVLVSTPVIEVGIDIPDAAIIVIESAERYGLASLHQLRGRVGRGEKPGHCLVFMSNNSRSSYKRLKYLEEINDGLALAEIDMEIRGYGDVYGTMQHGFKRFKVAKLSDLKTLEKAKNYAQEILSELDNYPLLNKKLIRRSGRFVGSN